MQVGISINYNYAGIYDRFIELNNGIEYRMALLVGNDGADWGVSLVRMN